MVYRREYHHPMRYHHHTTTTTATSIHPHSTNSSSSSSSSSSIIRTMKMKLLPKSVSPMTLCFFLLFIVGTIVIPYHENQWFQSYYYYQYGTSSTKNTIEQPQLHRQVIVATKNTNPSSHHALDDSLMNRNTAATTTTTTTSSTTATPPLLRSSSTSRNSNTITTTNNVVIENEKDDDKLMRKNDGHPYDTNHHKTDIQNMKQNDDEEEAVNSNTTATDTIHEEKHVVHHDNDDDNIDHVIETTTTTNTNEIKPDSIIVNVDNDEDHNEDDTPNTNNNNNDDDDEKGDKELMIQIDIEEDVTTKNDGVSNDIDDDDDEEQQQHDPVSEIIHIQQISENDITTTTDSSTSTNNTIPVLIEDVVIQHLVDRPPIVVVPSDRFGGIRARPFVQWNQTTLPCYPPHPQWKEMVIQNTPTKRGLLYVKPYKTGSSTTSGVHLRISRNIAKRRRERNPSKYSTMEICDTRFDHGPNLYPGYTLYRNRNIDESFLWTIIRDPTKRAISQFFHFEVSRQKKEPTDQNFQRFVRTSFIQDYYLLALYTKDIYNPKTIQDKPVNVANHILRTYNFIGITERMDESFVVLMMIMNLKMADILYLSAKTKGGYDDAGGRQQHTCTYIWPSFISSGMKEYFNTTEWKTMIRYDTLLYQAVNRSLDMTIDLLGRDIVQQNLVLYQQAQSLAHTICYPNAIFPCDPTGKYHYPNETDCIWRDSGCGTSCLDDVATQLQLW